MDQEITDWENYLRGTQRRSERTISAYTWNMRKLAAAHPGRAPLHYTRRDLERYLAERSLMGWSDATARQALAAYKGFFSYCCGKRSPAAALPFPRKSKPRRRPRVLSGELAGDLLASCETMTAGGRRELALVALMLDTGLRSAEVCGLLLADLDVPGRVFEVIGKGGRRRAGRFSAPTADCLALWLDARPAVAGPGVRTVFVSVGGLTAGRPLTTRGLRALLGRAGRRAGLPALAPHDLRRSFAHLALRAGAPTRVLQVAGGWQQLREVETYSREISTRDFDAYSPMAGLMA